MLFVQTKGVLFQLVKRLLKKFINEDTYNLNMQETKLYTSVTQCKLMHRNALQSNTQIHVTKSIGGHIGYHIVKLYHVQATKHITQH